MAVYVDEIRNYGPKGDWCHMWSDGDLSELEAFARGLDLKPSWRHDSKGISGDFKHYDLRPSKRAIALRKGAEFLPLVDWIRARVAERQKQEGE